MSDIVGGLKKKRLEIEELRRTKSQQYGQELQLLKQLKDECGADSISEAEEKLEKLNEEHTGNVEVLKALDTEMDKILSVALSGSNSESSK
jgi:L-ribulose-5-phosphate 3-epimerase UlaE